MKFITSLFTAVFLVLLLAPSVSAQSASMTAYELSTDSKMWVEGTSTLHDWECPVTTFTGTIKGSESEAGLAAVGVTEIVVKVDDIECEKDKMNKKIRKAFDMDDHPDITFAAETAELAESDDGATASAVGSLSMAGVTREVTVVAELAKTDEGRVTLKGRVPIIQTEFDIDPPSALLGTIKTGDEVFVNFEIYLEPAQAN